MQDTTLTTEHRAEKLVKELMNCGSQAAQEWCGQPLPTPFSGLVSRSIASGAGTFMRGKSMVTIFEAFSLFLVVFVPIIVGQLVAKSYGPTAGIQAGILSAVVCITAVVCFYWARGRRYADRQRRLREKYREIYRVIALPAELSKVQKPEGAEIRIGDYGWEAEPLQDDGFVYLQGLTRQWRVVWYAGFGSDQIEKVSAKPQSQYDWKYSWERDPPRCPFPVQTRETPDMGLPMARS